MQANNNKVKESAGPSKEVYTDIADGPDLEAIVNLALKYHATTQKGFFPEVDLTKVVNKIAFSMVKAPTFLARAVDSDAIVGVLILDETSPWFSNEKHLTDVVFYIEPEFRTYNAAKGLLDAAKQYAIINKQRLRCDIFNPDDLPRKEKLMKRLGFKPLGAFFEMIN